MILFNPMPSGVSGGLSHYGFEGIRMNIPGDSRMSLFRVGQWSLETRQEVLSSVARSLYVGATGQQSWNPKTHD